MILKHIFLGYLFIFATAFFAQQKKDVLFTIDNKPFYTDEFSRIYNKNINLVKDESQKDLDQYLELFIGYKLKVTKAIKLGLDKNAAYISELKSNRTQLAKNYLTDSKVTQELVDEAYNRLQKEVRVSHILLMVDENAAPSDTIAVYNKIMSVRKRAVDGEDFGKLAEENSMDTSVKENKGDLGYFSAFRMVYSFENGAFTTKKGEISNPIRSRFGYHLIKVIDSRDNRGEMSAAHIMIMKAADPNKEIDAKSKIDDIYKKIQLGENFENLAKEFSEDKSSSDKGGVLNKFASGQLSSTEFEDVAFSLTKENPLSKPFQSQYGWHIIKFIERFAVKSAKEMQQELSAKIGKDERSRKISNAVNTKLKKEFQTKTNDKLYAAIEKTITPEFVAGTWKTPEDQVFEENFLSINNKQISGKTFLAYVFEQQNSFKDSKLSVKIIQDNIYEKFLNEQLNKYADENLESKFPEFANVMEEYKDGLLLFDLMEKEIWTKSKTDTVGLKKFHDLNRKNYVWKNRFELLIASSAKEEAVKNAMLLLQNNKTADEIKKTINTDKVVDIMISEGVFEEGNSAIPKNVISKIGITDIIKNGTYFYVTKVKNIISAGEKSFEEAKGKVVNDYQQYLEENWVSELKKEFKIEVNKKIFNKVKKEIKKIK